MLAAKKSVTMGLSSASTAEETRQQRNYVLYDVEHNQYRRGRDIGMKALLGFHW